MSSSRDRRRRCVRSRRLLLRQAIRQYSSGNQDTGVGTATITDGIRDTMKSAQPALPVGFPQNGWNATVSGYTDRVIGYIDSVGYIDSGLNR